MSKKVYQFQLLDNTSIIEVVYFGEARFADRVSALNEAVELTQKNNTQYNWLIDLRKLKTLMTIMEDYEYGEKLAACKELKGSRIAMLRKAKSATNHMIDTVALNRGYNLKEFESYEEALSWLKKA